MRILIVCGSGIVSGKEKVMISLMRGLLESGHNVHTISTSWGNGQFNKLLSVHRIPFSKVRLGFISMKVNFRVLKMTLHQFLYYPKLIFDYHRIVRSFNPELVIHTNFQHLLLLYPAIRKAKGFHVYHSHESIRNSSVYQKLFRLFNRKIGLFVGVSNYASATIIALGISDKKIVTIYNGINVDQTGIRRKNDSLKFKVGIVGQVGEWKGHEDLVEAINIARTTSEREIRLIIIGEGDPNFVEKLKHQIAEKGISEQVVWRGYLREVNDIYSDLDVVCVPSTIEESLGLSALEPGVFGVPVVVSSKGGLPEIVTHGYNGYIVAARDPENIAHYLGILQDSNLAKMMGANHRQVVIRKFSIERFMEQWNDLLKSLK